MKPENLTTRGFEEEDLSPAEMKGFEFIFTLNNREFRDLTQKYKTETGKNHATAAGYIPEFLLWVNEQNETPPPVNAGPLQPITSIIEDLNKVLIYPYKQTKENDLSRGRLVALETYDGPGPGYKIDQIESIIENDGPHKLYRLFETTGFYTADELTLVSIEA